MIMEGGTWAEEVVLSGEDDCGPLFFSSFRPRNGKLSGTCTIMKFTEYDWGRVEDMVLSIKGDSSRHSGLTQASASKESGGGDCPDGGVERVREVDAVVQNCEVLNGNWGAEGTLVSGAFFVSRGACELDPVIIAIPRCMVDQMPAANSRQPGPDRATSLMAPVFTNEGAEEGI